jgi:ML domain
MLVNGVPAGCPVHPNIEYSVNAAMEVPSILPAFTNTLTRVEFLDDDRSAMCLEFRADLY